MPRVLVTGGSGFIGSHLVDRLVNQGHEVISLDKRESLFPNSEANYMLRDLTLDGELLIDKRFEYVFHLAGLANLTARSSGRNVNSYGSIKAAQFAASRGAKFIFSSSAAVYSPSARLPITEDAPLEPLSDYGKAKLEAEQFILRECIDPAILRFSNVYGPRQTAENGAVVPTFIGKTRRGEPLKLRGDPGQTTRDFVYVGDVVSAVARAMDIDGGIYNVSTGTETSLDELVRLLEDVSDARVNVNREPLRPGEVSRNCLSSERLKETGWKPRTSLKEGLGATYQAYCSD